MHKIYRFIVLVILLITAGCALDTNHTKKVTDKRYYAHQAVEDRYGVIAPWYQGQNGQCDLRIRIAAETLKRYPWADKDFAISPAPHFVYNGHWKIDSKGKISIPNLKTAKAGDWDNGDFGPRAAMIIFGMIDYYKYSGDPAAISILSIVADTVINHCQTPANHPWPNFMISCPTKGKPYGKCDPHGFIQLDHVAEVGLALVKASQLTGNKKWMAAAMHWADLLAKNCNYDPGSPPWGRHANPEDSNWGLGPNGNIQTGGVSFILTFFDELIRIGYTSNDDIIVKARDRGRRYLRDVLLPKWFENPTWGYNYWDWPSPVTNQNVVMWSSEYIMNNPDYFGDWLSESRNILLLILHRSSVYPNGMGDVYSGAWVHPESSSCCEDSTTYGPQRLSGTYAMYGALAKSQWASEIGRREILLATYDVLETGVVVDGLLGKPVVTNEWFKIAHPLALYYTLRNIQWQPEILAPNRENHIVRSSSVVEKVVYGKGRIEYSTFDGDAPNEDVLRLAFCPKLVKADGKKLERSTDLQANGYSVKPLKGGDYIVTIRHDGYRTIVIEGDDPQQVADNNQFDFEGDWAISKNKKDYGGDISVTSTDGASMQFDFTGNQVRLVGRVDPTGGRADVYIDGSKQPAGIDSWCPQERSQQILYYKNGLKQDKHTIKIVATGTKNPLSNGKNVYIDAVQWSAAEGDSGFGSGGGPTETQRVIFGYPGRTDYIDTDGNAWRTAIEVKCRLETFADSIARTWWIKPQADQVENTKDPELYRYGMHAKDFTVYFTVGPGTYHVRMKFAETQYLQPNQRSIAIYINGERVVKKMDVFATADGANRAVDLVFNDIKPKNGVIGIRFKEEINCEAIIQAIEVGPGNGGKGAKVVPVCWSGRYD